MTNYYVIGNGAPLPDLSGTPYVGYEIRTENQMGTQPNAFNAHNGIEDGDNVVVSGSVETNLRLRPADDQPDGFKVNVTILENAHAFNVNMGETPNFAEFSNTDMTVNVLGDSAGVSIGTNGIADIRNLTVNVAENASIGDIFASNSNNTSLTLIAQDGATIGDVDAGAGYFPGVYTETGGNDNITLGNNVTIGEVQTYDGNDNFTAGSGLTSNKIDTGFGNDTITVGANSTINSDIVAGSDVTTGATDEDSISIGAGSTVGGAIRTNVGDDTVTIGDNVSLDSVNTYLGNDSVTIGSGVTVADEIFTGAGSDTVVAQGPGTYTVDQGIVVPNDDVLVVEYGAGNETAFNQALTGQGYTDGDTDGTFENGFNSTFTYGGNTFQNADHVKGVPCFAQGTMIETARGVVDIAELSEGDLVATRDNGMQPIRWISSTEVTPARLAENEKLRPIRICKDALGANIPSSDLIVSPQHRVLVRSKIAQRLFGAKEVLVAARELCLVDGIDVASDIDSVVYFHMLFDRHEVVISNGAETESLFTGPQALLAIGSQAREEIFALFPELKEADYMPSAAREMAKGRMGRKLAIRHKEGNKALVN